MAAPNGKWKCSNCGAYVNNAEKYCPTCGSKRIILQEEGMWECPNCGDFVDSNIKYCPHCGSDRNHKFDPAGKKSTFSDLKPFSSSQTASKQSSNKFKPYVPQNSDNDTLALWQNIGDKLEGLAVFGFILGVIVSFICAIVLGKTVEVHGYYTESVFNFWRFLLILAGGSVGSYLGSMSIFALGRLVNNSERAARCNEITAHYMEMQARREFEKDENQA